jgi:hypothetical protein
VGTSVATARQFVEHLVETRISGSFRRRQREALDGGSESGHREALKLAYSAAQLRDPPAGKRDKHKNSPRISRACLCGDDHDLSARHGGSERPHAGSAGRALIEGVPRAFGIERRALSLKRRECRFCVIDAELNQGLFGLEPIESGSRFVYSKFIVSVAERRARFRIRISLPGWLFSRPLPVVA